MKSLEEKKLLVKMARMLGQPVDPALVESIEREENLTKIFFKQNKPEEKPIPILKEDSQPVVAASKPLEVAQTNIVPKEIDLIQQTVNVLKAPKREAKDSDAVEKELETIRKTIAEMMQKISTMSWGGGGTGIVRVWDADDFNRNSRIDDKQFVTFRDGWFQMDYINPKEIVANTTLVTSNTYRITNNDYYIGVNAASTVTITLPPAAEIFTGREFYVKDESGNAGAPARWIDIYPSDTDKIDGQNYVRLQIDHGGLKFIYHNGWRVI